MISTRAEPSRRPRWKMGPHSTRNCPGGYTSASGYSRTRVMNGSSKQPGSNKWLIVLFFLHFPRNGVPNAEMCAAWQPQATSQHGWIIDVLWQQFKREAGRLSYFRDPLMNPVNSCR